MATTFKEDDKQQNPYLTVKQKLRPAGSEKLQQQHKHQSKAIASPSASSNEPFSMGGYSLSSGRRRSSNINSGYKQRSKKSLWKRLLNALYSLVYNVFLHALLWAVAFAIGFHLPAVSFLQDFGDKETLLVQASSAILLSLVFTSCQKTSRKRSGTSGGTYRSLHLSDPTSEYINVRERLRKSSMTLKQQQQEHRSSGVIKANPTKTSKAMRCFLFLYPFLSLMSLVATCAAVGFYCHDHHDDYYMILTVITAFALTLWFQQRLALIWQTEEITAANTKRGLLKTSPVAPKGMEGSRDLKLEETMRIFEEQKSLLKKLEEEENQEQHQPTISANMDSGSSGSTNIIKTSPVPPRALEAARDLKLEETMRICLEQKGRLKKRGDPTKQQN